MSYNFSANQFDREFKAKRLGNWEVPKWYPDRPRPPRKTPTRIIVNERGHLLPGIQRAPGDSAWGNYKGTWDLPRKISRKLANELTQPPLSRLTPWERRSSHVPLTAPGTFVSAQVEEDKKGDTEVSLPNHRDQENNPTDGHHEDIMKPRINGATPPGSAGPLCVTGHSATPPKFTGVTRHDSINHKSRTPTPVHNSHTSTPPLPAKPHTLTPPTGLKPPLAGAYSNFQIAKQLHRENLQHRPLPDTVNDSQYRALEANRAPYPGKGLKVGPPRVSAVGYRGYGASGPSQCSKLRVYRPKTAVQTEERKEVEEMLPRRPSTGRVSDMQLAICWDLKPPREEDEPRPSAHIDGSNGSVAPAVFALVHQQSPDHGDGKEGCETNEDCVTKETYDTKEHCGTKEGCNTPPGNGESIFAVLPKSAWGETKENSSPNVGNVHKRSDSAGAGGHHTSATLERRKEHQSSPNLMPTSHKPAKRLLGARPCMACELKQLPPLCRPRSEYKMAFKAGKPSNGFDSGSTSRPQTAAAKQVRVPKPRAPFAKRSYSIDTLRPPFSLWPGQKGQGYPEHWRLASVYQHAYKPVEARRKPLLASVYQ